jgi:ribosome-binding protein aMBF1 (putative translation factor)
MLRRVNAYRGSLAGYVMARRGLLGMSQTELAEKAGLSKSEVNAIERGRVLLPRRAACVLMSLLSRYCADRRG